MGDPNELASPAPAPTDSPESAAAQAPPSLTEGQPSEPAQVEGGEGGAETPEPRPWADISEPSGLLDHEVVRPLVEERVATAREEAKKEAHSQAYGRMRADYQRNATKLQEMDERLDRAVGELGRVSRATDATGAPLVDQEDLRTALTNYGKASNGLGQYYRSLGLWEGAQGIVEQLGKALKSESFGVDYGQRIEAESQQPGQLAEILTDMIGDISAEAKKPLQDQLKEKDAQITRLESEAREAKRNGQPAPVNPPGGAGASPTDRAAADAVLRSGKSTPDEKKAAFQRKHGLDIATIGR